ncbi:hypothetical protein GZ77_25075 [Endozoicomonas montiporae]|uniref:Uncharacterized protein n=1 Tax=Endozoicomonas montiporae TaxID=1027273 RepID=A0A081MYW3_9GAMM|nr:hypothetical protein GZ77_25075 [Endozoicomonas montiporae]
MQTNVLVGSLFYIFLNQAVMRNRACLVGIQYFLAVRMVSRRQVGEIDGAFNGTYTGTKSQVAA